MSERCILMIGKAERKRRLRRADRTSSGYVALGFTFSTVYDAEHKANRVSGEMIGHERLTPDEFNMMLKLMAKTYGREALAWQLMRWLKEEGLCGMSTPHVRGA